MTIDLPKWTAPKNNGTPIGKPSFKERAKKSADKRAEKDAIRREVSPKKARQKIGKLEVRAVVERANGACEACGKTVADGAKLEVDHLIPLCQNGTNDIDNLQLLCRDCNAVKSGARDFVAEARARARKPHEPARVKEQLSKVVGKVKGDGL
jgi:5-methylcytosine-specific restriction endonuclease McrA